MNHIIYYLKKFTLGNYKVYHLKTNPWAVYKKSFVFLLVFSSYCFAQSPLENFFDRDLPNETKNLLSYGDFKDHKIDLFHEYLSIYQWDQVELNAAPIEKYNSGVSSPFSLIIRLEHIPEIWVDKNTAPDSLFKFTDKSSQNSDTLAISYLLPTHIWNINECNENCFASKKTEPLWVAGSWESIIQLVDEDFDIEQDWGMRKTMPVQVYSNCFGTARSVYDHTQNFKFDTQESFQSYLNEHFEVIQPGDKVKFGDMMVMYIKYNADQDDDHLIMAHASLVISKDYVWGRPSSHPNDKWGFEPIASAFQSQFTQLARMQDIFVTPWDEKNFVNRFRFVFWRKK